MDDPNVYIGGEAFEWREMFDFQRSGKPGECIQIVPALRKSAHWLAAEHSSAQGLLSVSFPFTSTISCLPARKPQGRRQLSYPALLVTLPASRAPGAL